MKGAARKKSSSSVLHGILSALVTPMTRGQAVACERLEAFADHLIRQGVHGLIPLGSTGEYYALTPEDGARCSGRHSAPLLAGSR